MIDKFSREIDKEFRGGTSFPFEIFPEPIQKLITDAEKTMSFCPDYLSAGILSLCATAIGNNVELFNGSYTVKSILWLAIIGRSGIGKTHPLKYAKHPLENRDLHSYNAFQEEMKNYEDQNTDERGKKPKFVKSILSDFTPEKLAESLQYNPKGLLIFKDELMGWVNGFDQYKKGGDQQKYLELWNGDSLSVDRITKEPILLEKTNVNILGGMQPKLLKSMASNNRSDDGFLSRFLFVYPTNLEPTLFTGLQISDRNNTNYNNLLNNLLDYSDTTIHASQSQIEIYKDWQHRTKKESHSDDLETQIQAKLETYLWRLALVIEMMSKCSTNCTDNLLTDESICKAIKLVEYFRSTALRVNDKILINNPLEDLPETKLQLYKSLPEKFKVGEVQQLFIDHKVKGGSIYRFLANRNLFTKIDNNGNWKKSA